MADLLAIVVLAGGAVVFAGAAWFGFSNLSMFLGHAMPLAANVILPSCLSIGALAAIRLRRDARLVLALCLFSIVPALYAAEWVVERQMDGKREARADFDGRSKIEVIRDLRAKGVDAYPVMRAKSLLEDAPEGDTVRPVLGPAMPALPLASLPEKTVVSCNETGKWLIYKSDRQGFHNPDTAWDGGPPAVMLLGDSFAHGSCVGSDENIAAYLRRHVGNTLNLGVSGFGPLSMLAALKEYGEPMRPKTVVWAFFEGNDLTEDLPLERRSPLLRRYLEDKGFNQGLMAHRDAWAARLKAFLDARLIEAMARVDDPHERLTDFFQLYYLREKFGLSPLSLGVVPADLGGEIAYLGAVLKRARDLTASWGGRLVFAYLPESARFLAASRDSELRAHIHDSALRLAAGLGLPTVDLSKAFAARPDPLALFVYPGSHYDAEGYRVAGQAIAEELKALH